MPRKRAARKKKTVQVDSLKHKDTRKNIPTEELRDFVEEDENSPKTILHLDPHYGIKFGSNWQVSTRKREVKEAQIIGRLPADIRTNSDRALRAEIDEAAWSELYSTISRPFPKPETGKIAVKVINHYGDEVLKVYEA